MLAVSRGLIPDPPFRLRWTIAAAVVVICIISLLVQLFGQTQRPDFTGTWKVDTARSELPRQNVVRRMIIRQSATELTWQPVYDNPKIDPSPRWTIPIGYWGPRYPAVIPGQGVKLVQAGSDGEKLIIVAGPGMNESGSSFLLMWRLAEHDAELIEDYVPKGFPSTFDFKESSIPSAYARSRRIYTRVQE
jgi:hypothetical protein